MNRLPFGFLRVFVAAALLPFSGFGQMPQEVADRLQQSINALDAKILNLQAEGNANTLFLQNLRQLRTNLIYAYQAANTPAGQLDVATISTHLHTDLQQSAFTDTARAHAAGVLPAVAPASPFTVNSGRSARLGIINPQQLQQGMPIEIPTHNTAVPQPAMVNVALPAYTHNIWTLRKNLQGLNIAAVPQGPATSLQDFQNNFRDYVFPGAAIQGPNPVQIAAALQGVLTPQEQKNILQSLYHTQNTFSGGINIRRLQGGEVLVRCCEQGAKESGTF